MLSTILSIANFILILTIVVLIHELGHFLAAKKVGIKVHEFGFGYPPRAIGWFKNLKGKWRSVIGPKDVDDKVKGTVYSINWLPFGGFVRMFGEFEQDAMGSKSNQAFFNKSKRARSLVILAGVIMNLLLGIVIFSFIYSVKGIPEKVNYLTIGGVSENSPASQANLQLGDKITAIDGVVINDNSKFADYVKQHAGQNIQLKITRDEQSLTTILIPRINPPEGEGSIGVAISNYDNIFYPTWQMPFRGAVVGIKETYQWTKIMIEGIGTMLSMAFSGHKPDVAGPIGIYQITTQVAKQGFMAMLSFIAILSINLAVVNILPFPALDGGRFVFILLEGLIGKKIQPKIEAYVNMSGMILLIALMILITIGDITRVTGH